MTRPAIAARAATAALVLVSVAWFAMTLPPRSIPPPGGQRPSLRGNHARGVIHVHTQRSDGSGSVDEVALAAARAGLDFLVITDHGNGMAIQPPTYRVGVLCIDAAEISTRDGHVVALGLSPTPYPLAGEGRDVVEDIHRFGGTAFAAHPESPKEALAWRDWDVPLDGFEWLNADSEWRDETRLALARTLAHYLLRGPESVAAILSRPSALLARWDRDTREGRLLTAYAAADAHARLGWTDDEESRDVDDGSPRWMLRVPSYETMFRVLSTRVELLQPLTGRADADAHAVLSAVGVGRTYSVIDGFARGGMLEFHGDGPDGVVRMGGRVEAGRLRRLVVRAGVPVTTTLRLLRNGEVLAETSGVSLEVGPDQLGRLAPDERAVAYRVDAFLGTEVPPGAAPWMMSNPIFEVAGGPGEAPAAPGAPRGADARGEQAPERLLEAGQWLVEKDGLSRADLRSREGDQPVRLDFALGPGRGPRWAAVAIPLDERVAARLADAGAIVVRLRSDAPMRASIQLRAASDTDDLRWVRSVFVDTTARSAVVPVSSLRPVGPEAAATSPRSASSLLVVVDQTNTPPGTRGSLWIEDVGARSER